MSLHRKHIVITRALTQSDSFAAELEKRGAIPLLYPCIAIAPVEDTSMLDAVLTDAAAGKFDWLVITSLNTVDVILKRSAALNLRFDGLKVAAVGAQTADSAKHLRGVHVEIREREIFDSYQFVTPGARILLPQSDVADETQAQALREHGAEVVSVMAYRNVTGSGGVDLPALLRANSVDGITFMSGSAVEGFVERLDLTPRSVQENRLLDSIKNIPVFCIGEPTARTAREQGLPVTRVANNSLAGLLDALAAYFQE